MFMYCRFGNFRDNFIFANSIKRHITCSDVKNSQLRQDLPISINDRVILPFREALFSRNFSNAKFRENKVLAKISEFTVLLCQVEIPTFSKVNKVCLKYAFKYNS